MRTAVSGSGTTPMGRNRRGSKVICAQAPVGTASSPLAVGLATVEERIVVGITLDLTIALSVSFRVDLGICFRLDLGICLYVDVGICLHVDFGIEGGVSVGRVNFRLSVGDVGINGSVWILHRTGLEGRDERAAREREHGELE